MKLKEPQKISPRFTLLEYFYILLKSVESNSDNVSVFESFKELKRRYRLGRSKYKTIPTDPENLTPAQETKYISTFNGVVEESVLYELIFRDEENYYLTESGKELLSLYNDKDAGKFNRKLFISMEARLSIFKNLIESFYERNKHRSGLLIFPRYSPRELYFDRAKIQIVQHIIDYSWKLTETLENDIKRYLNIEKSLRTKNEEFIDSLFQAQLLPKDLKKTFNPKLYNRIVKRFRDYWQRYFLKEIYEYDYSWTAFERWVYRGKQIGILHATEFYPNSNGLVIYPTSIVAESAKSQDFTILFEYSKQEKLFIHSPNWHDIEHKFVKCLVDSYFELRHPTSSYFISLPSLRELVCYKLRISEKLFGYYLEEAYRLNLVNRLQNISIALEVDKHPEDTKAMYLTKEPVMIDGKLRNIISIDVAKGGQH